MTDTNYAAREIQAAQALKVALGSDAEDSELLHDMIEGETSLFEMIDALADLIAEDQEMLDGIATREHDLKERKARLKSRQSQRRAMIEQSMTILETKKIERPEATLSLARRADKVIIEHEEQVPSQYWITGDPKLDTKSLREAVKGLAPDDETIPGVRLEPQPSTLTIRRK